MRNKCRYMTGIGILVVICFLIAGQKTETVCAAAGSSGIVDGSPLYGSAYTSPDDKNAGGYNDAVDYNDNTCSGKSSTWTFQNGYVFWSTKAKAATRTKTTLYRSIGWDITFSADLNGDGRIGTNEQLAISVARTIRGNYLSKMNYYYINFKQRQTDGVLYDYSLYAMSYDRLQELAKNHEAYSKNGKTPVADAIFSAEKITISIDAIMTTVRRDADGTEDIQGWIVSENGTGSAGVLASANGTVETGGTVYHCNRKADYDWLVATFNAGSIATYKNSGVVKNHKLTIAYYTDAETYGAGGTDGWSVNSRTGQICYQGKPYTESYYLWEDVKLAELGSVIYGEGYTPSGAWQCGKTDFVVNEGEIYHTSYLAQYASYPSGASNIYSADGTLKLYAGWQENGYTIEYYTRVKENASGYTRVAVQNCEYGKTYRYYQASNTSAPVIDGVELLYWAQGTAKGAAVRSCGAAFSDSDYPKSQEVSGLVIKLYAVWGVTSYTITCKETKPSDAEYPVYELYGIGFTTEKSLAKTTESQDPFYWGKSAHLVQASALQLEVPEADSYIWNGFWDRKMQKQYFLANGNAVFSSAKTFEKDTTIYGSWKKNYTLTVMYRLGEDVSVSKNDSGYGVDADGYLTVNGKRFKKELLATDSVTILAIPDCVQKEGSTKAAKWRIDGTSEKVAGGKSYTAKTLAKKAGGDLASQNVTVILAIPWSTFQYYVDYYFWNDTSKEYEIKAVQSCLYGETFRFYTETQMEALHVPNGMAFAGWSRNMSDTTVTYQGAEAFSNLCTKADARISLYGVWTGKPYVITLNGNCPSDSDNPVVMGTSQICYVFGEGFCKNGDSGELQNSCTVRIPSCTGYVFKGFFSEQKGGTLMVDASGNSTGNLSFRENERTIYAQWEQKTYRITYDANGGTFAKSSWGNEQVVSLGGIAYGSLLPGTVAPFLEGYSFDGYTTAADGTGEIWYNRYLNSGNRRYRIGQDMKLYAKWTDDIVPTGVIRASSGNSSRAWTNQNVQLTITGSDAGSGVVKIQLFQKRYFESAYQLIGEWDTAPAKSYTCSTVVETNGISNFYCVVWDAAGNTNRRIFGMDSDIASVTATTIYIDKVAPEITEPEIEDRREGETSVHVSLYASDDVIE